MDENQALLETICFVFLIVIITFGTIGNMGSLIIWTYGENSRSLACSTYFKLISASDICVLLTAGVFELLRFHPVRYFITEYSTFVCKTVTFGRLFTTQISTSLVVTITIERTRGIHFPLKHNTKGSRKRAFISVVIITVLSFSFTSLFLVAMAIPKDIEMFKKEQYSYDGTFYTKVINISIPRTGTFTINSTECNELISQNLTRSLTIQRNKTRRSVLHFENMTDENISNIILNLLNNTPGNLTTGMQTHANQLCDFVNLSRTVEHIAWFVNYVILICCMPLTIIMLCNTVILVQHCLTHQSSKCVSANRAKGFAVFTRLVLAIGLVYTLSTLPMTLYVLTHFKILNVEMEIRTTDILSEVARALFCLNNGANFILYFLSGQTFRKDFKHLFRHFFKRSSNE